MSAPASASITDTISSTMTTSYDPATLPTEFTTTLTRGWYSGTMHPSILEYSWAVGPSTFSEDHASERLKVMSSTVVSAGSSDMALAMAFDFPRPFTPCSATMPSNRKSGT